MDSFLDPPPASPLNPLLDPPVPRVRLSLFGLNTTAPVKTRGKSRDGCIIHEPRYCARLRTVALRSPIDGASLVAAHRFGRGGPCWVRHALRRFKCRGHTPCLASWNKFRFCSQVALNHPSTHPCAYSWICFCINLTENLVVLPPIPMCCPTLPLDLLLVPPWMPREISAVPSPGFVAFCTLLRQRGKVGLVRREFRLPLKVPVSSLWR